MYKAVDTSGGGGGGGGRVARMGNTNLFLLDSHEVLIILQRVTRKAHSRAYDHHFPLDHHLVE